MERVLSNWKRRSVVLWLTALLGACSGGGDDGGPAGGGAPAAPAISSQPVNLTVTSGQSATFSVSASGEALAYQWQRDGAAIPGADAATLTLPAVTSADNGARVRVTVANAAGSVDSSTATLTVVLDPIVIQTQPQDAAVAVGASASFSVGATGSELRYQWLRDGAAIAGATAATYTTGALAAGDDGALYTVQVLQGGASVLSSAARLSVSSGPAPGAAAQHRIALGDGYAVGVRADGSALAWGTDAQSQLGTGAPWPNSLARVVGVDAIGVSGRSLHSVALGADGRLYGWGTNHFGQLGNLPSITATDTVVGTPVALAGVDQVKLGLADYQYSFAVRQDGSVWHWPGVKQWNSPGDGTVTVTPSRVQGLGSVRTLVHGASNGRPYAVLDDGTVWEISLPTSGSNGALVATVSQVPNLAGVRDLACSAGRCTALLADGTLLAWGDDQVGDGTAEKRLLPVAIGGLSDVTRIAVTSDASFAITADGRLWTWGFGPENGTGATLLVPTLLPSITGAVDVAANANTVLVLLADGSLRGWGRNFFGELSDGTTTDRTTPVQVQGITLD